MPFELDDDLSWMSFLYVSGEMSDADRSAFEGRLDREQEAREAVAEAVGMVEAVASLPPGFGSTPSRPLRLVLPGRRRLAWLAAACLVVASIPAFRGLRSPEAVPAASASVDVALAWSDSLDERADEPVEPELLAWINAPEANDALSPGEGPASPPSWLLLAAAGPQADPDGSEQQED